MGLLPSRGHVLYNDGTLFHEDHFRARLKHVRIQLNLYEHGIEMYRDVYKQYLHMLRYLFDVKMNILGSASDASYVRFITGKMIAFAVQSYHVFVKV